MIILTILIVLINQSAKTSDDSGPIVNEWKWVEGTKFVGKTLSFEKDGLVTTKNPREMHIYTKILPQKGSIAGIASDTEIVGGTTEKKQNPAVMEHGSNVYAIGVWNKRPLKKNNFEATISWGVPHAAFLNVYLQDISSGSMKIENIKITGSGLSLEMTGICSYDIEYAKKGDRSTTKEKENNVPVKFIASRRPAQPKPMVFSPQTLAELEDIRRNCKSESKLESIESKTSLVLNGKEITFDIRRGGSGAYTVSGNNPYINLPTRNDGFLSGLGYMEDMAHAANELGNIIFDGLDGKLDGNCMSPDGRRISQLEAEALSDKFTSDLMNYYLDPVKNPYPFSKYFPNDPLKRQAILDICPLKAPSPAFIDPSRIIKEFNKFKNIYEQRNNDLMDANELVKQGKIKEAKKLLEDNKRFAYICRIPDSAEFFANTQTPEPPK